VTRGAANVISGNSLAGVQIYSTPMPGSGPSGNVVLGNLIGTDITGTANLGNSGGVSLNGYANHNTIGGTVPGSRNVIAFNYIGVEVAGAAGTSILGNSIAAPGLVGIDRNGDGLKTPIITGLTVNSVSGTLTSSPGTRFRLEFFASPGGGPPGQGQVFLGYLNVTTDAVGTVAFTAPVAAIPASTVVTATATNLTTGDTSEFSPVGTQLLITGYTAVRLGGGTEVVTLSAQLFSAAGPVAGAAVTFSVAGLPGTVTGVVNAGGVVTVVVTVPPRMPAGSYLTTASFSGDDQTDAATGTGLLTVPRVLGRRWRL
jgi:hypothetical protein